MDASQLRALQAPLKQKYRDEPAAAMTPLAARGAFSEPGVTCTVDTWAGPVTAGLHPATGGDGSDACSGDMLLQALLACAGVTFRSIATTMGLEFRDVAITAEGFFDARGTLGVARDAPVGCTGLTVTIELETDADEAKLQRLAEMTEKYCVVGQTLREPPTFVLKRTGRLLSD